MRDSRWSRNLSTYCYDFETTPFQNSASKIAGYSSKIPVVYATIFLLNLNISVARTKFLGCMLTDIYLSLSIFFTKDEVLSLYWHSIGVFNRDSVCSQSINLVIH